MFSDLAKMLITASFKDLKSKTLEEKKTLRKEYTIVFFSYLVEVLSQERTEYESQYPLITAELSRLAIVTRTLINKDFLLDEEGDYSAVVEAYYDIFDTPKFTQAEIKKELDLLGSNSIDAELFITCTSYFGLYQLDAQDVLQIIENIYWY